MAFLLFWIRARQDSYLISKIAQNFEKSSKFRKKFAKIYIFFIKVSIDIGNGWTISVGYKDIGKSLYFTKISKINYSCILIFFKILFSKLERSNMNELIKKLWRGLEI